MLQVHPAASLMDGRRPGFVGEALDTMDGMPTVADAASPREKR